MHTGNLSQIALPNMWLLVSILCFNVSTINIRDNCNSYYIRKFQTCTEFKLKQNLFTFSMGVMKAKTIKVEN